jgi:hypothetical protein
LDDTLVSHRMKVPRQTYHMLNRFRRLNYLIGIISYNCMVNLVAKETNLYNYSSHIFYEDVDRNILFDKCVNKIIEDNKLNNVNKIYYVDDRLDNLLAVKNKNTDVITYHCNNLYELYKLKNYINT